MTGKNENRRVRMTKRMIKDALLKLLETRELSGITVTAVCETADIHRSTFYHYYSSPAALFSSIEEDFLAQIPNPNDLDKKNLQMLINASAGFFDFVKENEKAFRILFSKSPGDGFTARMVDHLCSGYIPVDRDPDDPSTDVIRLYIANGTVGALREWIKAGFPVSSRKIAEMMYDLSIKVLS